VAGKGKGVYVSLKVCEAELRKGRGRNNKQGGEGASEGGAAGERSAHSAAKRPPAILLGWVEHAVGEGEGEGGRCQGLGESDCS